MAILLLAAILDEAGRGGIHKTLGVLGIGAEAADLKDGGLRDDRGGNGGNRGLQLRRLEGDALLGALQDFGALEQGELSADKLVGTLGAGHTDPVADFLTDVELADGFVEARRPVEDPSFVGEAESDGERQNPPMALHEGAIAVEFYTQAAEAFAR